MTETASVCGADVQEPENDELETAMKSLEKMQVKLEDTIRYHGDLTSVLAALKADADAAPAAPEPDAAQVAALTRTRDAMQKHVNMLSARITKIKQDIDNTKGWLTSAKAIPLRRVRVPVRRAGGRWGWWGRRYVYKKIRPNYRKIRALQDRMNKLNGHRGGLERLVFQASNKLEDLNEKLTQMQQPEPADEGHDLTPLTEQLAANVTLAEELVAKIKAVTI